MERSLGKIFGSRVRAKLLGWFFTHTEESFFVRQVASILNEDPTNLSREMANLEELGLFLSKREGSLKRFQVNRDCPFFEEMKGLALKTTGVAGEIKRVLDQLSGIDYAFTYGSYAKGEEKTHSDIDIMIIGEGGLGKIDLLLAKIEKKLGREINYVFYNLDEYRSKRNAKDGFMTDVFAGEKIMLIGKEDGLKAT